MSLAPSAILALSRVPSQQERLSAILVDWAKLYIELA